jgi:DNA polymerase-1
MFIASAGYNLLSLDYSQIELRVLAHLSNDKKLIEAFQEGKDIHTQTACIVFNRKEEEITEELRKSAKAINFGIIYGMGAHGLAEQLGISHSEAREFIESFFRNYPEVKKYIDTQLEKARLSGYVENMFGRIRYLPQIRSDNFHEKSAAERIAINTPIQGTAADITKLGMINLYSYFVKNNLDAKLLLQIHDEIIIEYNEDYKEDFVNLCKNLMTNIQGLKLTVPLSVKSSIGKSWGDL